MAIVLIEEVVMGLDDVRDSLAQAVTVLEGLVEDIHPDLGENLRETLEQTLLVPLQSRVTVLDKMLDEVAAMS
jgi:hypothetical protein